MSYDTFLVESGQRTIGLGAHNNISWIQASNPGGSGLTGPLSLNPSGGNIGIGMTIPEVRLHVQGAGNEIAHFTGANNAELKLRNSNSNILFVYSGAGDTLQVGTGGQNVAITIDTNQNIATQGLTGYSFNNDSSNTKIFEVTGTGSEGKYGTINISGNTNSNNGPAGSIRFINRENSSSSSAGSANSRGLAAIQAYAVTTDSNAGDDSGGYFRFVLKSDGGVNAERLRIKGNGSVYTVTEGAKFGISQDPELTTMGSTSGTWQLPEVDASTIGAEMRIGDINSNSVALIRLASYGSSDHEGGGAIMFTNTRCGSNSHHSDLAAIKGARESLGKGYLRFFTASQAANDERMRITSTGHLGLGDNNPDTRLSVTAASGTDVVGKFTSTDANAWIQFRDNSTTDTGVMIGAAGDDMMLRAGSNERVRITSAGRVGINETSPDTDLHIKNTNPAIYLEGTNGSGRQHKIWSAGTNSEALQLTSGNLLYNGDVHYFRASNESTEYLRIDSSGNMGLGTGSGIDRQFHIQGSAPIIKLEDTGGGYSEISANTAVLSLRADQGNTQSSSYINFQVDGGEKVRITSAGLVGINETSPEEQLHITHASAPGIQLEATAGGPYKSLIKMGGNDMEIRGSSGQMEFYTGNADGDSSTKRLTITSGGDIESANSVQSGGNATSGFKIGSADTAAYMSVQSKSVSNGGSTSNAAFQAWLGSSNTFRVNANGLIKTNAGIDFSGAQTNYSGMSSEVLDSYEEGTFTPSINGMGSISYSLQAGKYTKIGRVCYIIGYINWSVSGSPANDNVAILGLPFSTDPGKIAAGGTRLVGNISLEGTSNESTTHQLEPYGNNGVNIITDDEKGNKANELGGNSNMYAKYQFWYHTS